MNELLWFLLVIINFAAIMAAFRLFGKKGLFFWVAVATIIANIQVMKTIELFGLVATLGNIIYGTIFLATDILNELYGPKEARKAVWIGFFSLISVTAIMQVCLLFIPHQSDFAHEHLQAIFGFLPRIAFASLTAYIISQFHDVWAYNLWRRIFSKDSQIWIRNNASTMVSQAIDSIIFCLIAYVGVFEWPVLWQIVLTTYILKWIVAACDTPLIYLARYMENKKGRADSNN